MPPQRKTLKILYIADPLANFDPVAETTLYIMKEAQRRGHKNFVTTPQGISAHNATVVGRVESLRVLGGKKKNWYEISTPKRTELKRFDAILLRKDPPFDTNYINHLYLLELVSGEVYLMNHPSGILMANEKIMPLPFTGRTPPTLISADDRELSAFIQKQGKGTIIKPLGEAGGRGVFYIRDPLSENIRVILETATAGFTRHVVAQAYVPQGKRGDKRILLLGQEILGAFLRKPAKGEHRANLHAGGSALPAKISRKDREIIELLRPNLARMGLDFVGLDIIGDSLIEVNVTSPMGIHEINKVHHTRCEGKILDYIEEMCP